MNVDVTCDFCNGPMQTESTKIRHESVFKCVACINDLGPSRALGWALVSR